MRSVVNTYHLQLTVLSSDIGSFEDVVDLVGDLAEKTPPEQDRPYWLAHTLLARALYEDGVMENHHTENKTVRICNTDNHECYVRRIPREFTTFFITFEASDRLMQGTTIYEIAEIVQKACRFFPNFFSIALVV